MVAPNRHRIVIVGGGTAGITVAARLRRRGESDVVVIEPSDTHRYQPLWTLVGSGHASAAATMRPEANVMPKGVQWIRERVVRVDPEERTVETDGTTLIHYEVLVLAPGLELHWAGVDGLEQAVGKNGVVSNYRSDTAERTWAEVQALRSGKAVFTQPDGPIKCGGAPQKATYMSCDHWRRAGVLDRDRRGVRPSRRQLVRPAGVPRGTRRGHGTLWRGDLVRPRAHRGSARCQGGGLPHSAGHALHALRPPPRRAAAARPIVRARESAGGE